MILAFIAVAMGGAAIGLLMGAAIMSHFDTGYKKRWETASRLLREEQTKTGELTPKPEPKPRWTLAVQYPESHGHTNLVCYARCGDELHRIAEQPEIDLYPNLITPTKHEAKKTIERMNT